MTHRAADPAFRECLAIECYRREYGRKPRPGVDLDLYKIRKSMPDWFVEVARNRDTKQEGA